MTDWIKVFEMYEMMKNDFITARNISKTIGIPITSTHNIIRKLKTCEILQVKRHINNGKWENSYKLKLKSAKV